MSYQTVQDVKTEASWHPSMESFAPNRHFVFQKKLDDYSSDISSIEYVTTVTWTLIVNFQLYKY